MKIVLDTNVLVSGLLTPFGPSGEIVRMISAGVLILCIDARVLAEYAEVLYRPKFKFNKDQVDTLISFIRYGSQSVSTWPLKTSLPDPDDEPFLEAAIAGKVKALITGNMAHFPISHREGINILPPSDFLEYYRKESETADKNHGPDA